MGTTLQNWLFAMGGVLIASLVAAAKDWLGAQLKLVLDSLYGRFAGSRLLRRAALKKYTRELYRRHREFPVSFQVAEALRLPMESVYVPLRAAGPDRAPTHLDTALRLTDRPHTVVLGDPGAGKTMLLRHETLMWARRRVSDDGRKVDLGDLDAVPVLFDLHRLSKEPDVPLRDHLVQHFERHGFPRAGTWLDGALNRGGLVLHLDGLDEVATELRPRAVDAVKDLAERHPDCRIVVTCRTAVYEGQFTESFHQTLRVRDFDEHLVRRFLTGWPWRSPATARDSVDQLLGALRDTPQLMPLARNPLLLTMIAHLYDFVYAGTDQALPHTRADFYKQVIDNLLIDRSRGAAFPAPLKKAVLRHLALDAQDVPSGAHDRLARPVTQVLATTRALLEENSRDPVLAPEVIDEIVERSGLLLAVDSGERHQFAHLTLQEYLAAECLADDPRGLLDRYRADPPAWRETVRLWCGATARDCTEVVREVFALDPVLAFQCLADAHRIEESPAAEILAHFRERLATADEATIAAFGLVASDRRRQGARVFAFLRDAAADRTDTARAEAAVRALAATNLPQAAEALTLISTVPAWAALVSMGDLAVPHLAARAGHSSEAVKALWEIRTPAAALALVPLLWPTRYPDQDHLLRIALHLGELLTVPEIEEALRTSPVPPFSESYLDWVWRPFAQGPDDALVMIAGRIALILDETMADPARTDRLPANVPVPDPRIVAALVVIGEEQPSRYEGSRLTLPAEALTDLVAALRATGLDFADGLLDRPVSFIRFFGHGLMAASMAGRGTTDGTEPARHTEMLQAAERLLAAAGLPAGKRALLQWLPEWLRIRALAALCLQDFFTGPSSWSAADTPARTTAPPPASDFDKSPHYRGCLLLCLLLSAGAAWQALGSANGFHPWGPPWLGAAALVQIVLGWTIFLLRGGFGDRLEFQAALEAPLYAVYVVLVERDREALVLTGMALLSPAVLFYSYVGVMDRWGALAATLTLLTVAGAARALYAWGILVEKRIRALTHPVRTLVLDALR